MAFVEAFREAFVEALEILREPGPAKQAGFAQALPAATTCTGVTAARSSSPVRIL